MEAQNMHCDKLVSSLATSLATSILRLAQRVRQLECTERAVNSSYLFKIAAAIVASKLRRYTTALLDSIQEVLSWSSPSRLDASCFQGVLHQ